MFSMDLFLFQPAQQLFLLSNTLQQTGTFTITSNHIIWSNNGVISDLTPILQDSIPKTKKTTYNLITYYKIGEQIHNKTGKLKLANLSPSKRKTAQRVYELVESIGEDWIEILSSFTPSMITRLSNSKFQRLKTDIFLQVFGGPQTGEGDDLSSVLTNTLENTNVL